MGVEPPEVSLSELQLAIVKRVIADRNIRFIRDRISIWTIALLNGLKLLVFLF